MNILQEIAAEKRGEVADKKREQGIMALTRMPLFRRRSIPFAAALLERRPIALIAEFKRSSPSAGMICRQPDPAQTALSYQSAGAAAVSVLTDEKYFSGRSEDLTAVRNAVAIPVLRKDFIIDEYQIVEAKAYGADAVLLIASILDKNQLFDLFSAATEIGLECLVELYESSEIDILDVERMKLVGINNRDLRTFSVDTGRSLTVARRLPGNVLKVAESGIHSSDTLREYASGGISAALVGEHLMKAARPGEALKSLIEGISGETSG